MPENAVVDGYMKEGNKVGEKIEVQHFMYYTKEFHIYVDEVGKMTFDLELEKRFSETTAVEKPAAKPEIKAKPAPTTIVTQTRDKKVNCSSKEVLVIVDNKSTKEVVFEHLDTKENILISPNKYTTFCMPENAVVDGYVKEGNKVGQKIPAQHFMYFTKEFHIYVDKEGQMEFDIELEKR